jgi:hypothetical protein
MVRLRINPISGKAFIWMVPASQEQVQPAMKWLEKPGDVVYVVGIDETASSCASIGCYHHWFWSGMERAKGFPSYMAQNSYAGEGIFPYMSSHIQPWLRQMLSQGVLKLCEVVED